MKRITLTLLLLLFLGISFAQYQNVMISDAYLPEEPSIMINPKNPDQLVAGANLRSYYISEDGGYNWTRGNLISEQNGVYGDPAIIVDTAGDFYYDQPILKNQDLSIDMDIRPSGVSGVGLSCFAA